MSVKPPLFVFVRILQLSKAIAVVDDAIGKGPENEVMELFDNPQN